MAAAHFQMSFWDSETQAPSEVRGKEASSSHTEIPPYALQTLQFVFCV